MCDELISYVVSLEGALRKIKGSHERSAIEVHEPTEVGRGVYGNRAGQ